MGVAAGDASELGSLLVHPQFFFSFLALFTNTSFRFELRKLNCAYVQYLQQELGR
jgi:hypothetical protein